MNKNIENLKIIHELIKSEKTGTVTDLADKLHVCKKTVYNYFDEIRDQEINLEFSREKNSFYYDTPDEVIFEVEFFKQQKRED